MNKIFKSLALFFAILLSFTACDNTFSGLIDEDNGKCKLSFSVNNSDARSTITAENLSKKAFRKAEIMADETVIGQWEADGALTDDNNAIKLMEAENTKTINAGMYDFLLSLYDDEGVLIAVSTIKEQVIKNGDNPLKFTTQSPSTGKGKVNVTVNWNASDRVGKIKAGLFTVDSDTTAVENFGLIELPVTDNSAVYQVSEVPCGVYYIKFNVYSTDETTIINSFMDIVYVETGRTSKAVRALSNVNSIYTVTLKPNSGNIQLKDPSEQASVSDVKVVDGEYVIVHNEKSGILLPTESKITRAGYTFNGWKKVTNDAAAPEVYKRYILATDAEASTDCTFEAQWSAKTYKLSYFDGDAVKDNKVFSGTAENSPNSYIFNAGTTIPVAVKTGYIFGGWFTDKECTAAAGDASTGFKIEASDENYLSDLNLYAKWTPIEYTIAFTNNPRANGEDITGVTGAYTSYTNVKYDEVITLKDATKTEGSDGLVTTAFAYAAGKFTGWTTTPDGALIYSNGTKLSNLTATNGATVTLYAKWLVGRYQLAFDANGGSGITNGIEAENNKPVTLSANTFVRPGYTFAGWSESADGAKVYDDGASVTRTQATGDVVTLYALWTPHTYTLKFNSNGYRTNSRNAYGDGVDYPAISRAFGEGVTGSTSDQVYTYDVEQTIQTSGFTNPTGYKLVGWNTKQDGTGIYFAKDATVKNVTAEDGGVINLYAVWEPITFTIKYNKNNDKAYGYMSTQRVEYDAPQYLSVNSYMYTGYKLTGWSTTAAGTVDYNQEVKTRNDVWYTEGAEINLYAVWTPIHYSVTVYDVNETKSKTYDLAYDQTLELATIKTDFAAAELGTDYTISGAYTFDGWSFEKKYYESEVEYTGSNPVQVEKPSDPIPGNAAPYNLVNLTAVENDTIVLYPRNTLKTCKIKYEKPNNYTNPTSYTEIRQHEDDWYVWRMELFGTVYEQKYYDIYKMDQKFTYRYSIPLQLPGYNIYPNPPLYSTLLGWYLKENEEHINHSNPIATDAKYLFSSVGNKNVSGDITLRPLFGPKCTEISLDYDFVCIDGKNNSKSIKRYCKFSNGKNQDQITHSPIWTTSDSSVCTVTGTGTNNGVGVIKSVGYGTAVVSCRINDKMSSCLVIVNDPSRNITYTKGSSNFSNTTKYGSVSSTTTMTTDSKGMAAYGLNTSSLYGLCLLGRPNRSTGWKQGYSNFNFSGKNQGWSFYFDNRLNRPAGSDFTSTYSSNKAKGIPIIVNDNNNNRSFVALYTVIDCLNVYSDTYISYFGSIPSSLDGYTQQYTKTTEGFSIRTDYGTSTYNFKKTGYFKDVIDPDWIYIQEIPSRDNGSYADLVTNAADAHFTPSNGNRYPASPMSNVSRVYGCQLGWTLKSSEIPQYTATYRVVYFETK